MGYTSNLIQHWADNYNRFCNVKYIVLPIKDTKIVQPSDTNFPWLAGDDMYHASL